MQPHQDMKILQPPRSPLISPASRLPKQCPYIGTFQHAPGAKNRARRAFFEDSLTSGDEIKRRHDMLTNPYVGFVHREVGAEAPGGGSLGGSMRAGTGEIPLCEFPKSVVEALEGFTDSLLSPRRPDRSNRHCLSETGKANNHIADVAVTQQSFSTQMSPMRQARNEKTHLSKCEYASNLPRSISYTQPLVDFDEKQVNEDCNCRFKFGGAIDTWARCFRKGSWDDLALCNSDPSDLHFGGDSATPATAVAATNQRIREELLDEEEKHERVSARDRRRHIRKSESFDEEILSHKEPNAKEQRNKWMAGTFVAQKQLRRWHLCQILRNTKMFRLCAGTRAELNKAYEVDEDCILGQGSYASVIRGRHRLTGELVAIKMVKKKLLFSDAEQQSVRSEIDNQRCLIHPHVVRLFEVFETDDVLYLVQEYCSSGDLKSMIFVRRRLTEIEAKRVCRQLLQAVAHIHAQGLVHGDLKPQNLLFSPPENSGEQVRSSPSGLLAKVTDFGTSRRVPDVRFFRLTGDVNLVPYSCLTGTASYIAPEIHQGLPYGKPADIWSVGVCLYEMMSGRVPFLPSRACLERNVDFGPIWASTSQGAQHFIRLLLRKNPKERLTAVDALRHPWLSSVQHLHPFFPHTPASSAE